MREVSGGGVDAEGGVLRGFPGWSRDAIFTPALPAALRLSGAVVRFLIHQQESPISRLSSPLQREAPFASIMADRDNLVYQAKLAEQAERYDGKVVGETTLGAERFPPSVSLRGRLGDAGKTEICWVREDKMAEIFPNQSIQKPHLLQTCLFLI